MDRRLALVVGNSSYESSPLINPRNDARDISATLVSFGFQVHTLYDCTADQLDEALGQFQHNLKRAETGLFFFAGHGTQIDNSNYLLMIDTNSKSKETETRTSISLDRVLRAMNDSEVETKIVILDACRTENWTQQWRRSVDSSGLASVFAPKGTIIGFATSPGETASDGVGENGLYTSALLNQISAIDRPIEAVFKSVRNEVAAASDGAQTTWEHTSLSGDFFFNTSVSTAVGGYSPEAFSDEVYEAEPGSFADQTIRALKTYNWYEQNPAVSSIHLGTLNQLNLNEIFVIGRNILQAATGDSSNAINFMEVIRDQIAPWPENKARAVLDGILFEMFFDSSGAARDNVKGHYLNHLTSFRKVPVFKGSLDFISSCLREANIGMRIYPNQANSLSLIVKVEDVREGEVKVIGIWMDGLNILQDEESGYSLIDQTRVKENLESSLKIPSRQLEVSYQPDIGDKLILYPLHLL